jgi:hypothetical protein
MAAPDRMGQPSNPRQISPHHRSFAMNVFRDQAEWRGASRGRKLGSRHSETDREVESNFAASQTDRRYRAGTSMQAAGDLYRDEAIDKTLLIVTANHLVTALNRCSTSRLGVPTTDCEPRSNVSATYTSTGIATTTHSSAAVRPAESTRGCFRSCLALTPGCFIGTTRRD